MLIFICSPQPYQILVVYLTWWRTSEQEVDLLFITVAFCWWGVLGWVGLVFFNAQKIPHKFAGIQDAWAKQDQMAAQFIRRWWESSATKRRMGLWSKCWPENADTWIQLFISDFRQVQWDKLTCKNSYPHLICLCAGLFLHLSAGLAHSADTWCPLSHSTFEMKPPHVRAWRTCLHPG